MEAQHFFDFGPYRLDLSERVLLRDGRAIPLAQKDLDTLVILVEHNGHIVEKEELLHSVWPDTFVEEGNIARRVSNLRRLLSAGAGGHNFIETVPKRGYRFVAPVNLLDFGQPSGNQISVERAADTEASTLNLMPPPADPPLAGVRLEVPSHSSEPPGFASKNLVRQAASPRSFLNRMRFGALLTASAAVLLSLAYVISPYRWTRSSLASNRVMLAVLPVQNLTGDSKLDFLTDGLTEELISQTGGLNPRQLGVIARTSSMVYKNSEKTVSQIAAELGVDYVVEASMRGTPDHMRFTAQLIRARDQTHLWARDFDRSSRDIVALEDDVSRSIAQEIQLRLAPTDSARMERELAVRPDSYQSYLQGRLYLSRRTKEGIEKGLDYFLEAAQQDPANARAYAGIADAYNMLLFYGYSPGAGSILKAKGAAQKAIEMDDSLAEGHAAMAYVYFMWLWQWPDAEREFRHAITLDYNYVPAHHWYGLYLAAMARHHEADQEIKIAEALDPRSSIVGTAAGYIHYFARDYGSVIRECKSVLNRDPNFIVAHAVLGEGYEAKGAYSDAIAEFQKAIELSGGKASVYKSYLGHVYAISGDHKAAEQIIGELDAIASQRGYIGQYGKALIYSGLGETDQAIEALQAAGEQNDSSMIWLNVDPRLDSLRSDSRFRTLASTLRAR